MPLPPWLDDIVAPSGTALSRHNVIEPAGHAVLIIMNCLVNNVDSRVYIAGRRRSLRQQHPHLVGALKQPQQI